MSPSNSALNPVALYEQLPLEQQRCLDEINFLASELRDHLLPEQFMLTVNAINQRLQKMHPHILCQQGCSQCCETHLEPTLTGTEWQWVKTALNEMSTALKQRIAHQLKAKSEGKSQRCPLLIEGRCSVYAVRPLDCRLQGYSFSETTPFTCQEEQLRMHYELQHQINPLAYMFMPQHHKLKAVFSSVVSQHTPLTTLSGDLQDYFSSLSPPYSA